MGLVLALMLVVGLLFGLKYAKKMVTDFTESSPAPLPALHMDAAAISQAQKKVEAFTDSVRSGKPTPPLELTTDEVNALIATNSDLQPLRGKVFVTIDGSQIKGQVSFPMDELGVPMFKGRYLNGSGAFNLTFRAGVLRLTPQTLTVKGKPVPDAYMDRIKKQNLASSINQDPRASAAMDRLEDIQVKENKLIIVPKTH